MLAEMSAPRHASRILCCALSLLAALSGVIPGPARAQEREPEHRLELLSQPVWHRPGDLLDIRIRITNGGDAPLQGFLLSLAAHPAVRTRSTLHSIFEGTPGAVAAAFSEEHDQEIAPGDSTVIVVDQPLASLSSLTGITDGGVYPVTVTISDPSGVTQYDEFTTPLIIYPARPEPPLNLALVLPLNELPSRGPEGSFRDPSGQGGIPLERAVAENGWLTGLVTALQEEAGELPSLERRVRVERRGRRNNRREGPRFRTIEVPQEGLSLGLAPTPRFIEELADLADGYRRGDDDQPDDVGADEPSAVAAQDLLNRLRALLGEAGIQTLLAPYSFADLPSLLDHAPERIDLELDEGAEVIEETLGLEPTRDWLFAPAARLDAQTLEELRFEDADTAGHVLFHPAAFEGDPLAVAEGCPESFASFTCPVVVRSSQGPTQGLVGDQGLQDRFAAIVQRGDDRLDLQRLFAETAAIRQELPSVANRVIHATVPSLWHPTPALWSRLLAGLREAPWLATVTPAEGVALREPVARTEGFIPSFPPLDIEPDAAFFDAVEAATEFVESFRRMQPPEQLLTRLRRNTLVAESRLWWPSFELFQNATDYIVSTEEETRDQISRVSIGGPEQINLTSQRGEIPLVVSNGASFPTVVRVTIRSLQPDLSLDPVRLEPQRINADDAFQFTVQAESRSSGIFPVEVLVETPNGELDIATKQITIRSTEFNQIALAITLGAFGFLVLFYFLRVLKRRRPQPTG